MEALVQRIDAINTRMSSQPEGGVDSSAEDMDVISEGQLLMAASFGRFVENDALGKGSVAKLGQSLSTCASTVKETVKRMGARAQSQQSEAQTASQTEIDKLKKRLSQIETDLESKDRTLLEQETQMLALTDQVELH